MVMEIEEWRRGHGHKGAIEIWGVEEGLLRSGGQEERSVFIVINQK